MMLQTRRLRVAFCLAFLCTFTPRQAQASMFGEENVILGSILAEQVKETLQITQAVITIKEGLGVMRDTANFARDAVQVVQNVKLIMDDPVGYMKANAMVFMKSFPEVEGVVREASALKKRFLNLGSGRYDPYAYFAVLQDIKETSSDAYSTTVHAVDQWRLSEQHDDMIERLREAKGFSSNLVQNVYDVTGISPQMAQVYNAQSSALIADATIDLAAMYQDMILDMKLRFQAERESQARGTVQFLDGYRLPQTFEPWTLETGSPANNRH